jgi:methionine-gamma-lyase
MKNKNDYSIETICATDSFEAIWNAHNMPVFATSTFVYESAKAAADIFSGKNTGFIYSRWSHPNAVLVEEKIAQLEGFGLSLPSVAWCFASGMAALNALFQSLLKSGEAILAQGNIYGSSVDYFNHFGKQFGIHVFYEDFYRLNELEELLKQYKNIRVIYCETPSNPTVHCYDLSALHTLAKKYSCKLCVDNTFATPLLQQPLKFGADFVLHSATKFLNGHGNALSGAVISTDIDFMREVLWKVRKLHGSIIAPFDAWLLNTGIKTLPLRMKQHCRNAMQVAEYLSKHRAVAMVNYLGLSAHRDHSLAQRQMTDYGGVLSFVLKEGKPAARKMLQQIKLCKLTASLGTCDTLIQHPASMSHSFVPPAQREKFGITDGLIRISVGLEDVNDIIHDVEHALS